MTISRRTFLAATGGLLTTAPLASCADHASRLPADTIYRNARIWTGVRGSPLAQALAVSGNRIGYVGDNEGARAHAGRTTRVVDLAGAFMMPGFIDSHTHFERSSFMLSQPQFR